MIKRFVPWATVVVLLVTMVLPVLPQVARGEGAGTPVDESDNCALVVTNPDQPDIDDPDTGDSCNAPASTDTITGDRDGDGQDDSAGSCPDDALDGCLEPSTAEAGTDQDGDGVEDQVDNCPVDRNPAQLDSDGDQTGDTCDAVAAQHSINVADVSEQSVQASATLIEVYCDIPDVTNPDQRTVGTFVNSPPSGYGNPTISFSLEDLAGAAVSDPTGPPPMPASNPITGSPPYPNNWEWGPGGYSSLTVSAVYPSLDPADPDLSSAVSISCVPDPFTPTPTEPPTPTMGPTPTRIPTRIPAGYTPIVTTEMRDTNGNIIPDGATVAPGTGVYDIATVSGLQPNTSGRVFYQLYRDNCRIFLGTISRPVVQADANGVAVAPDSAVFTVPGTPGGFYDWRVVYQDSNGAVGISGCGAETFFVEPPPADQGTGSARLTCFVQEPAEPGRAGYKVNVSPLPATGTVEVNVTLELAANTYEYTSVTLPPGTTQDLEFYGAYTYAWVTVIYRDAGGEIYAVVNLEGKCAATSGPTPTFGPTLTATLVPTGTLAPTNTATLVPTGTGAPASTATLVPTSPATSAPTFTQTRTQVTTASTEPVKTSPAADPTPGLTSLPNTGSGPRDAAGQMPIAAVWLIVALSLTAITLGIRRRGHRSAR